MNTSISKLICQNLVSCDGVITYHPHFFDVKIADMIFQQLDAQLDWHQETLKMMGKQIIAPRLVCWYGDNNAVYTYSGITHKPAPWIPVLSQIKQQIDQFSGFEFNSVLANLYRNGQDSMGWHADKEKSLGVNPVIASVSFGAERLFKLRHNKNHQAVDIKLEHGSLLIMAGCLQHHWRHCLPKTRNQIAPRINLTFRLIIPGYS
ncbi:MAG: alpha-ketoglutarate-dependent dioxygenase AlkB [Methylococcales bacterium]